MKLLPELAYTHGTQTKIGILLVNLGTPETPTPSAVKKYLAEFLGDPRVVELPRLLWLSILHGIILNTRPKKTAQKYATIWENEGSPLKIYTEQQTQKVSEYLTKHIQEPFVVKYAMRYGEPSIKNALTELQAENCDRILVMPLYPQYASSTTGTVHEIVFQELAKRRNIPALRAVKHFHDHQRYIDALATRIKNHWQENGKPEKLVISFHGVPEYTLKKGDPYYCECHKTGRLLAERLELDANEYVVTFQSQFGKAKWVEPYTEQTVINIGKKGVKHLGIVCPGFLSDCLETLEEISHEVRSSFFGSGGEKYDYVPCLNASEEGVSALGDIILENIHGWYKPYFNQRVSDSELELQAKTHKIHLDLYKTLR